MRSVTSSNNSWSMQTAPVSDGSLTYIVAPPKLIAYRPGLESPVWTADGNHSSMPAVADGVVYSLSAGQLRASDAQTGDMLWTFMGDGKNRRALCLLAQRWR